MSEHASGTGGAGREGGASRSGGRSAGRFSRRFKIVRVLRRDRPFAVVMAMGLVLGGAVLVGVPKVWRVTPDGFPLGVVRVSALDFLQAWSLSRSARRAEAMGADEAALFAWRGALVNNPGDPALHRGFLRFLATTPEARSERTPHAVRSGVWLMALTRTNVGDVGLVAGTLERYGRPRTGLAWLDAVSGGEGGDGGDLDRVRARCLLSSSQWDAFSRLWRVHEAGWSEDRIQGMYRDAWLGATDDRTAGLSATVRLKEGLSAAGEPGLVAARLLALVASVKGQADDLGMALEKLEARGSATAAQHGYYWRVLASSGRGDEAKRLAESFSRVAADPEEAAVQWRAMREVGATNALSTVEGQLGRHGSDLTVWRTYFDLLADAGRWKDLQSAAAGARLMCGRLDPLYAEALLAEYRSMLGEGRRSDAARLAEQVAVQRVWDAEGLMRVSSWLRLGESVVQALSFLGEHESRFREMPGYWGEVFAAGLAAKDLEVLRRSVGELLRIEPDSPAWVNNRAAFLLITGEEPAEALRLTMMGLSRHPGSATLRINHALALVANGRASEAEGILLGTTADRLSLEGRANYELAWAQVHALMGREERAAEVAAKVDRGRLLPPQVARLERILGAASGRKGPGGP